MYAGSNNPREVRIGGEVASVCVPWSFFIIRRYLRCFFTIKFCSSEFVVFSSLPLRSPRDRVKLRAPRSFAMEGFLIILVWSCALSMFFPTIPRISPCKSLRGRSTAKQHEMDHCGFLRHSLKYWYTYTRYWTADKINRIQMIVSFQIRSPYYMAVQLDKLNIGLSFD